MILHTNFVDSSDYSQRSYSNPIVRRRGSLKPAHKSLLIWHLLVASCYLRNHLGECAQNGYHPPQLVDLTHTFDNDTIYWVTEPTLTLNVTFNGTFPGKDYWYQKDIISAATHGGTHLDAPSHFAKGRWSVSEIPLSRLVARAVVIDVSDYVDGNPDRHLRLDHVLQWEDAHGPIPDGSLLLVNTGWSRFWPDKLKYCGTVERGGTEQLRFPSIEPEVAEWLVEKRNVVGVGIDTMSVDVPNTRPNTHITLMENNVYGLENMKDLHLLPATGAVVYVMPMKLRYASGAPCRVVAQIPEAEFGSSLAAWCMVPSNAIALVAILMAVALARI